MAKNGKEEFEFTLDEIIAEVRGVKPPAFAEAVAEKSESATESSDGSRVRAEKVRGRHEMLAAADTASEPIDDVREYIKHEPEHMEHAAESADKTEEVQLPDHRRCKELQTQSRRRCCRTDCRFCCPFRN